MKVYYESDADPKFLSGKTVAIVGYGSQGHAHAQNLKESGVNVIVAEREKPWGLAEKEGFQTMLAPEAAQKADLIMMLVPDELAAGIYREQIAPHLRKGNVLAFAHGFNIHYNQVVPRKDVDVIMIAPKGPGHLVRRLYTQGSGVPCLIAIHQDASGKAKETALAYARGIGGTRAGVIETTFREETETDLFGEQVVLCGGLVELIRTGYETLVEAGYQPEMAYFECLHEMKLIVDLVYEGGIMNMNHSISNTAEYGEYSRGPRIINKQTKEVMKDILKEIQDGSFAREWVLENQANGPVFKAMKRHCAEHPIEEVGQRLRGMMAWLKK